MSPRFSDAQLYNEFTTLLFQIRGALNAIRVLTPATLKGKPKAVVTHSSGNHGQALTYAAKLEGTELISHGTGEDQLREAEKYQ
jgi:threonine synthase